VAADVGEDAEGVYGEVHLKPAKAQEGEDDRELRQWAAGAGEAQNGRDDRRWPRRARCSTASRYEAKDLELTATFRIGKEQLNAIVEQVNSARARSNAMRPAVEKTGGKKGTPKQ